MVIGLDVSPLALTRAGTARYIRGLLAHLTVDVERLSFGRPGRVAAVVRDVAWYPWLRADVDVLHCPSFRGPLRPRVPLVVTVHDLAILRHPETFNRWHRAYSRLAVPRVIAAAARVIAVSEFTKRELVELLGVDPGRVRVIPNAVEDVFAADGPAAEDDYVLAVSTLEPRKNLPRLAEATRRLGVELRVVGARGWGDVPLPDEGVRWLGEVSDGELAALYRGARCLAYPSLYEGFGIPVAEAMACGCPVVTSVASAMAEIAGDYAVYVDPLDPASIAAGIERVSPREARRPFTWDRVAAATEDVYRELA